MSLYTAMKASNLDEAALAAALSEYTGKTVKPRRIATYLEGVRCPKGPMLLAISHIVGLGMERLLEDHPKNKFVSQRTS